MATYPSIKLPRCTQRATVMNEAIADELDDIELPPTRTMKEFADAIDEERPYYPRARGALLQAAKSGQCVKCTVPDHNFDERGWCWWCVEKDEAIEWENYLMEELIDALQRDRDGRTY